MYSIGLVLRRIILKQPKPEWTENRTTLPNPVPNGTFPAVSNGTLPAVPNGTFPAVSNGTFPAVSNCSIP